MLLGLMALVTVVMHMVSSQESDSNVLRQGGSKHVQSEIATPRTRASLSCESGDMVVKVNFTQPFRGLMYAHRSRTSPCRMNGNGGYYYQLRIPLKGCGTWQESPRVFVNNITIRFHQALELEEDETKTVVCRYPPPLTPPPGNIHIITPVTPKPGGTVRVRNAGISEVEILILICLLLFFSLLTVGIGIAYFCLKRRNIHLIRRKSPSSAPASQLTKLSTTPLQSSVFTGSILEHMVRIPRAIPYSASVRANTASDRFYEQDDDTTESPTISRDSLESTPTTSTTSSGSAEGTTSEWLQRSMAKTRTLLTIPKAILRRDDAKRRTLLHKQSASSAVGVSEKARRSGELEDQTVTTLLEPEYSDNGSHPHSTNGKRDSNSIPVYAKVEKKKQRVRIMEGAQIMNSNAKAIKHSPTSDSTVKTGNTPGTFNRKEVTLDKLGMKMLDEIISSTSTSQVKPLTTLSKDDKTSQTTKEGLKILSKGDDYVIEHAPLHQKNNIFTHSAHIQRDSDFRVLSDDKNLCIQDISDVYLTTTVETESTEIRTTITRDIIEEHVKDVEKSEAKHTADKERDKSKTDHQLTSSEMPKESDKTDNDFSFFRKTNETSKNMSTISKHWPVVRDADSQLKPSLGSSETKVDPVESKPTDGWNVIIRQKKPPISMEPEASAHRDESEVDTFKPPIYFDVKIRSIPPKTLGNSANGSTADRRDSTELVDVPKLEMPHSIEKLRRVMAQLGPQTDINRTETEICESDILFGHSKTIQDNEKALSQSKAVSWSDNTDLLIARYTPEPVAPLTSSDSFRSETSLRERSSSEVLEKAPTLFSGEEVDHRTRERSSSEFLTSPGDHSIWIKEIPVLQTYSPDFLANIPVASQSGFSHDHVLKKTTKDEENDKESDNQLGT